MHTSYQDIENGQSIEPESFLGQLAAGVRQAEGNWFRDHYQIAYAKKLQAWKRYNQSDKGKVRTERYINTPGGQAARKRANDKRDRRGCPVTAAYNRDYGAVRRGKACWWPRKEQ